MKKLIVSLIVLILMGSDVILPLLYAIPFVALIVTAVAIVRRIKGKNKPSRAAVIFLSLGGFFAFASVAMFFLSKFDLSLYLFGVGSSVLRPIFIGLSALCLIVGILLLMKGMIRKWLIVILTVALSLWFLVFSCILSFHCICSTFERIDEDTVVETEMAWHNSMIKEYEIIFPGLMKEIEVTYQNSTA